MAEFESVWSDLQGVPFSQGYLDAGGVRTRYLHAGDPGKPTLVLLHGSGGHAEAYVRNLEAHAEHFSTWSIDMLGHGYTDKPGHPLEIAPLRRPPARGASTRSAPSASTCPASRSAAGSPRAPPSDHPDRIDRLVLNTAGGSQADPEVMKRIITLSMAAVEDPTWETVQARIKWLMADKSKDYDDIVASRQRIYRQPGFVAAMSDIMALQDPEIRARNLLGPDGVRRHHGADAGAVDQRRPDRRRQRGPAHRVDDPRCALRGDARLRALAAVRGRQDVQRDSTSTSCWAAMTDAPHERSVDVLIVGAGPVGLTLANILGLQGVQHAGRRRARHSDRLSARRRTRRRVAAHVPVDRAGRGSPAAHRAQSDPAVLRRQAAAARRDGAARRAFRLAQAQRLRAADGRRRIASRPGPIRPRRGAVEHVGWRSCAEDADGVTVEFADGHEPCGPATSSAATAAAARPGV